MQGLAVFKIALGLCDRGKRQFGRFFHQWRQTRDHVLGPTDQRRTIADQRAAAPCPPIKRMPRNSKDLSPLGLSVFGGD